MEIQLQVNGKPVKAVLALPAGGKGPGLLVLHAWWGLNSFFKRLCERLAEQGYVVLAPDLNEGQIAQSVEAATELMERRDNQIMHATVMAAKDFLLAHPACTSPKLGVIGFSMGAAWALVVASEASEQVATIVLFYGTYLFDFSKIHSKVLGHFSDVDEWEPIEGIQALEKAMQTAGLDVSIHFYPGRRHWFMEDDRPEYDPEAANLAWERTIDFLKDN
jgi:carboxymethylenebutenolidase